MASSTPDPDGTEDVNDFLQRIRQLGEQRDKEDEERTKKLEEEILQGRRERQARRAERARSISPTKDSPLLDAARLSISSIGSRPIDPPEHLEPTTQTTDPESSTKPDSTLSEVPEEPKANEYGMDTSPTRPTPPSPLARSRHGTLSWQQRPLSREFGRSLFSTSPTRANRLRSMSSVTGDSQGQERSPSRDQNPHTWSANDTTHAPRQTADRELESPMLQKNTADDVDSNRDQEVLEAARENTAEQERQAGQQHVDERSRSPSRASSTFGDSTVSNRYSSMSSVSTATGLGSPLPSSSVQRFEPPKAESSTEEQLPPSPTQRRLSPERPSSPTKGMGGFVQSAMMKRSDTVSKRWSAQLPSSLTRNNSISSNRNSIAVPNYGDTISATSPPKLGKDAPSFLSHRPSSSHSEATVVTNRRGSERPSTPPVPNEGNGNSGSNTKTEEGASRPSLTLHARTASILDKEDRNADPNPTSPVVSRTMDPKRWSPTKATWLESALNRPDSPRHKKQPSQTSWKDRQSRGSVDLGRSNSFKEVTPAGLMRPVPPGNHYKKPSITGLPDLSGTLDTGKGKVPSSLEPSKESDPATMAKPITEKKEEEEVSPSPSLSTSPEKSPVLTTSNVLDRKPVPLTLTPTPNIAPPSPLSARDPASPKPKAQSPVIDFRANLRKREVAKEATPKGEPQPEFKNIFGKLKKTEKNSFTQQNELKDNILKGRAALNATGGPKKNSKPDEMKEGLLKQKDIRTGGGLSRRNTAGENDAPAKFVPEAIARRHNLSKSSSVRSSNAPSSPSTLEPGTPRDLQSLKSPVFSPQTEGSTENIESLQISPAPDDSAAHELEPKRQPEPQPTDVNSPVAEPSPEDKNDALEEQIKKDDELGTKQEDSNASEEAIQPVRALPSETVAAVATPPAPAATEGLAAKGNKLAGRINPALAGLLSRGPSNAGASDGPKHAVSSGQSGSESAPGAPLTHVTKSRARGPRRRAPGATATSQTESPAVVQPELHSQPEQSVGETESSAPKDDAFAQSEVPIPNDEPLAIQTEQLSSETEPVAPNDESPAAQFELPAQEPEPSAHLSSEAEASAPNDKPSAAEPELNDPKEELQTAQTELPISQPEASPIKTGQSAIEAESTVAKDEPVVERESVVSHPESPVPNDEVSTAQIELPVSQPEPSAQPELPSPKDEPRTAEFELPTTQLETLSAQQGQQSLVEPEPTVPKDESVVDSEPVATQPESPILKDDVPAGQSEHLAQPELPSPKDEPRTAEFELPTAQPEASFVQHEQQSAAEVEHKATVLKDEPVIESEPVVTQLRSPVPEHDVPVSQPEFELPSQRDEPRMGGFELSVTQPETPFAQHEQQSTAEAEPTVPVIESEPVVTQLESHVPKDDVLARQPELELDSSNDEPHPAHPDVPVGQREEFSVHNVQQSATEAERSVLKDDEPVSQPEPELGSSNDASHPAQLDLPANQLETTSIQDKQQSTDEAELTIPEDESVVESESVVAQLESKDHASVDSESNYEPHSAQLDLPASQPETSVRDLQQYSTEAEHSVPEEPSTAQPEPVTKGADTSDTQLKSPVPKDDFQFQFPVAQTEQPTVKDEPSVEPSFLQDEQSTTEAERSVSNDEPSIVQSVPATSETEASDAGLKSPAAKDGFQFEFEHPDAKDESSASQPEFDISKDEPPATRTEPVPVPRDDFSQFEFPVTQTEQSAAKEEPSVTELELDVPKDEPTVLRTEHTAREHEPATQLEPSVPRDELSQFEFPVIQTEQSTLKDEASSTQHDLSASDLESSVLELPVPKDEPSQAVSPSREPEPPASEPELSTAHQESSSAPKDESLVNQPNVLASKPEPVVSNEWPVIQLEPTVKVTEPQSPVPKDEPPVTEAPASEPKPPAQENGLSAHPEPAVSETKPTSTKSESAPKSSFEAARSVFDRSAGDSNSNWPLPDSPPTNKMGQREQSPPSEKGMQETAYDDTTPQLTPQPKSKIDALSPKSFHSYEDVENLGDSPAQRPAVPPKLPRTPSSEQRWSPRVRHSSQSPSPLRTSYKGNQMDSPVDSPQQRTFSGFGLGSILSSRHKSLPSPPVPPKRSDTLLSTPSSSASLVPQADESLEVIAEFFTAFPKTSDRVDIDPQLMLTTRDSDCKIRTLKKQVWEITGEGKRQDLPINQEYILYEGSMYLCVHTFEFESDSSTRSETHLWCGDDVPDHAIDDAQTFARKVAKEHSCKLEVIKQGKETARFIQAVGGILITRRGSNSRSSLSALYMLCGRKHLKQMVFDEVDFTRRNLCSGFPFVISAPFGKLYLWKGKGSTAEEIGAARLIGMDLGLTGEFEEVTEGEEPESFFEIFNYRDTEYLRSDDWQLKPNHEQFRCRLLRVDHELGQKSGFWIRRPGSSSPIIRPNDTVQEIEPYCYEDITPKGIYILDTYFELYVIVGEQAAHRPAEFASAVVFAHEYGILAASLQDRPFIPKSYVSIGGAPNSCRSAFRKWHKEAWKLPPQTWFALAW
ncbi:hypothetical protein SI65_05337 [Aspergillus cristatus]|uniref:Uncharacterized protein n=1 Tax=Aspergillus cristatus TaxID=573508 RepID=A0A1E3BCM0_ASPCR|nr:hypothetical protein SI65_05337 [Aspergillus cristatus]